ncbi:hypothetical protein BGZ67_009504, partial [Mortierella alpina]
MNPKPQLGTTGRPHLGPSASKNRGHIAAHLGATATRPPRPPRATSATGPPRPAAPKRPGAGQEGEEPGEDERGAQK